MIRQYGSSKEVVCDACGNNDSEYYFPYFESWDIYDLERKYVGRIMCEVCLAEIVTKVQSVQDR